MRPLELLKEKGNERKKALPVKLIYGVGYEPCAVDEATHVTLNIPGPTGRLTLPVILKGQRAGTGCWSWNGSVDKPTLMPSVKTESWEGWVCHSWVTVGNVRFLEDSSHELAGKTVELLEVE